MNGKHVRLAAKARWATPRTQGQQSPRQGEETVRREQSSSCRGHSGAGVQGPTNTCQQVVVTMLPPVCVVTAMTSSGEG